jgi:hypothetical protein
MYKPLQKNLLPSRGFKTGVFGRFRFCMKMDWLMHDTHLEYFGKDSIYRKIPPKNDIT